MVFEALDFNFDLEEVPLDRSRLLGLSDSEPESDQAVVVSSSDCSLLLDFFDRDRFFRFSARSSSSSSRALDFRRFRFGSLSESLSSCFDLPPPLFRGGEEPSSGSTSLSCRFELFLFLRPSPSSPDRCFRLALEWRSDSDSASSAMAFESQSEAPYAGIW